MTMEAVAVAIKPIQAKKTIKYSNGSYRAEMYEDLLRKGGVLILGEKMSKAEFERFSQEHELFQMERESDGTIIVMPVHTASGKRELGVGSFIFMWNYQTGKGQAYGPSTGFDMPDGSTRSPDAAWVSDERMEGISVEEEENSYMRAVPDFVVEVRSGSDRLPRVQAKMKNVWMKNGVRLAWLIDPYEEKVFIFRANGEEETIEGFSGKKLSGEDVMPGLEFPLNVVKIRKR